MAIFFIMSGYVCAIKPLRLARAGKPEEARKVIASSAFRRLIRLGMPATIATVISWFLCQIGAFNLARSQEGSWLSYTTPPVSPDVFSSLTELYRACVMTPRY